MGAGVSDDGRYAFIAIEEAGTKNRVSYIDLKDPQHPDLSGKPVDLIDQFEASYNPIGNDGLTVYFNTDKDAPNGRVIAIDLAHPVDV